MSEKLFVLNYDVPVAHTYEMPKGVRQVLSVQPHRHRFYKRGRFEVVAITGPREGSPSIVLHCRRTGHPLTGMEGRFIGSLALDDSHFHVFEETRPL